MLENKQVHSFDIQPIMSEIEKVIEKGLNKLLANFIERHELLEKTHQQLIQLPSIVEELNRRNGKDYIDDSDSDSDIEKYGSSDFISIKDMTESIVRDHVSSLENKLNKMEKKYDAIIPILDKLLGKITHLNEDIKELQNNNSNKNIEEVLYRDTIEKSSVVKSCENENIEIHIEESEELGEEEISDDDADDVNPLLITCSTITLKEEEKSDEPVAEEEEEEEAEEEEEEADQEDEELSVEQELGIEEIKVEEKKVEEEVEEEEEEEVEEEASIETESKEVIEEESADEEASVETETKEVEEDDEDDEEEDDEEEEIFEIDIDDKTYCTNNDENGFIWELTEDGEQGDKVGYFKEGEPFFYAEEN